MGLESFAERIKLTKGLPDILALGMGAIKGFSDSRGIPIPTIASTSLVASPIAIHAVVGGYLGLAEAVSEHESSYIPPMIKEVLIGTTVGAVETGLGYCIGYTIGNITK